MKGSRQARQNRGKMKFRWDKKYLYWGMTAMVVIGVSIVLFFLMFRGANFKDGISRLISICMPVLDGFILAYLMTPILNFIEKLILRFVLKKSRKELGNRKQKYLRGVSVCITLLLVWLVLYSFFSVVVPQVLRSIQSIVLQFPAYVNNLTLWLESVLADNPQVELYINNMINTYTPELKDWLNGTLLPQMNLAIRAVSSYAINVLVAVWNLILGLIISIYLMNSKEKFVGQAKEIVYSLFDIGRANDIVDDCRFIHRTFGGFLSGKLLDSLIIGILCFIGTNIIGTPYALLISVIIGVTNIIPFFGPYLGAIPSAILVLMIDPMQCLYFLIFILVLQQFDGNFLGPKILGGSTGLSSFWVIFSITIFGGVMGVPGMVIGVPTFAVIYAMIRRRVHRGLRKKNLPTDTEQYKELIRVDPSSHTLIMDSAKSPASSEEIAGNSDLTDEEGKNDGEDIDIQSRPESVPPEQENLTEQENGG